MLTDQQTKHGVLNGSITSEAWDKACTPHAGLVGDPFIQTKCKSTTIFALADGHPTPATTIALLEHTIREPAHTVNLVLTLSNYPYSAEENLQRQDMYQYVMGKRSTSTMATPLK